LIRNNSTIPQFRGHRNYLFFRPYPFSGRLFSWMSPSIPGKILITNDITLFTQNARVGKMGK